MAWAVRRANRQYHGIGSQAFNRASRQGPMLALGPLGSLAVSACRDVRHNGLVA